MRSDTVKMGFQRAPHRGLLRACGLSDQNINKPFRRCGILQILDFVLLGDRLHFRCDLRIVPPDANSWLFLQENG
ncbi:MAG: hypothetical protein FJ280_21590 [Planctomycetes bacterium]|nr:hypothetical protein [Planctomycetota bacterium]